MLSPELEKPTLTPAEAALAEEPKFEGGQVGHYQLTDQLAVTGLSRVYSGINERSGEIVAVKVPEDPISRKLILAETVLHLQNSGIPHVVTVDGYGLSNGAPFLATRLQEGGTLVSEIKSDEDTHKTSVIGELINELEHERDKTMAVQSGTEELIDVPALMEAKEAVVMEHLPDVKEELEAHEDLKSTEAIEVVVEAAKESGLDIDADSAMARELTLEVLKELPKEPVRPDEAKIIQLSRVLYGAADGLDALRKRGVTHRDVKPHNIGIDKQGNGKILDFGVATRRRAAGSNVFGTWAWMSPQAFTGDIHPTNDDFALAMVAYRSFTGEMPWRLQDDPEQQHRHMAETPVQHPSIVNPAIPGKLGDVVMLGLSRNADSRATAADQRDVYASMTA